MNETVKAALLAERSAVLNRMAVHRTILASARETVERNEAGEALESMALANLEAALSEAGVDLAAVDADAARRREAINLGGQHSVVGQQRGLYQDSLIGQNQSQGQRLQGFDRVVGQYDPTAGLAKALDEA